MAGVPQVAALGVPLATRRLLLVPLTAALAEAALAGRDELTLPASAGTPAGGAGPRAARTVRTARDWPTPEAAVLLARVGLGGADGQWLVVRPPTDGGSGTPATVVGECGVRAWWGDDEAEVGFGLAPGARGHGLGSEAVGRLVEHLLGTPGVRSVVAQTEPGNAATRRLLRRLGFTEVPGPGRPGAAGGPVTYRRPAVTAQALSTGVR